MVSAAMRLEQSIRVFEDTCFLQNAHNQFSRLMRKPLMFSTHHAVANWQNLRKTLLDIQPNMTDEELRQKMEPFHFAPAIRGNARVRDQEAFLDHVSLYVARWIRDSRRVFNISEDLQLLLDATSLEGVTLEDLRLPFDSFLISLAKPVFEKIPAQGTLGAEEVGADTVMVLNLRDVNTVFLWVMSMSNDNYQALTQTQKQEILKYLKRGNGKKINQLVARRLENLGWCAGVGFGITPDMRSRPIVEVAGMLPRKDLHFSDRMIRIVAGMCLYLKSLPPATPYASNWNPVHQNLAGDRILGVIDESHVCEVSTQFKLTASERRVFTNHTQEVMATREHKNVVHFRSGYWSRPKGFGHDPNALKTVWTRPTIVNDHLLRPGELPQGASTILLR